MKSPRLFVALILLVTCLPSISSSTTWNINPEGTGDAPDIATAVLLASPGDVIILACGTYYEHDIYLDHNVYIMSETQDYNCATIDAQDLGQVILCYVNTIPATIDGVTLANGITTDGGGVEILYDQIVFRRCRFSSNEATAYGGAVYSSGSPIFVDCVFESNVAERGGAVYIENGTPRFLRCAFESNFTTWTGAGGGAIFSSGWPDFYDCVFNDNSAWEKGGAIMHNADSIAGCTFSSNHLRGPGPPTDGGAIYTVGGPMYILDCLFYDNRAQYGGAVNCDIAFIERCTFYGNGGSGNIEGSAIHGFTTLGSSLISNCILSFGQGAGGAVYCGTGDVDIECTDIYGNSGGDWVSCISFFERLYGNESLDPCFCDAPNLDFSLAWDSPCRVPACGRMGAFDLGCGPVSGIDDNPPGQTVLYQNIPNPFNPGTTVSFTIPRPGRVTLGVFDVSGRHVRTLVDGVLTSGFKQYSWDGTDNGGERAGSGVYFYRLSFEKNTVTKKMILLK